MTIISKLFSFPSLTLAAAIEALVAIKLYPNYWGPQGHLKALGTILAINNTLGVIFWTVFYPKFLSPLRHISGPKVRFYHPRLLPHFANPRAQNVFSLSHRSLLEKNRPSGDLFLDLIKKYPGQEIIALDALGRQFLIARPRLLADLLVHNCYHFTKPHRIGSFLTRVLGGGLVTIEGDQHKFLRKNTMPAFHVRHIMDLYPMMWNKGAILMRTLTREVAGKDGDGQVVELTTWANKVTLDIIGIAGMGRALNTVEMASDPLQDTFEELLEPDREKVLFGMLSFILGYPIVRMLPWKMNQKFLDMTGTLDRICKERIKEKRDAMQNKTDDHFDILSLLIKSNNFDDEVLKDQLLTFLAAG